MANVGDTVRHIPTQRPGMVIGARQGGHIIVVAWDDAETYPQHLHSDQFVVIGRSDTTDHVVYDPGHPERHGKRRSELGLVPPATCVVP